MTTEHAVKLAFFMIASTWLVYFSRESLRAPRSHGFYRLFAWECILTLFVLNVDLWFQDPLSPTQLTSWLLLVVSAFLVLHAVILLRRLGHHDRSRQDVPLIGIEKT